MKNAPSVSEVCRQIDVNRTQFLRYLSGEAHPRPDVLYRICRHFNVDARVLLEPIEAIVASQSPRLGVADDGVRELAPASHDLIPDGVYISWGYATIWPGCIFRNPVSVTTEDGVRRTRTRIPAWVLGLAQLAPERTFHDLRGILIRQHDGMLLIERSTGSDIVMMYEFRRGVVHNDRFYHGVYLLGTSPAHDIPHGIGPVLLQRLPDGYRSIRKALAGGPMIPERDAPAPVRETLWDIARANFMSPLHPQWGRGETAMTQRRPGQT